MQLRIGETFAGYRILRLVGSGGMGEVYLARHPRLPREVALKVLHPDISNQGSFRERFIREADLAAGLRHPHIVGVQDRGEDGSHMWIAMDYIDGTDVAQLLQQRYPAGMPVELAAPIVTAVASALDYAHKKGLLHRDVKPANIIVADIDSDDQQVFLADFGIARPLDDTSGLTTTNMTVGTVAYAAPEQLMGEPTDGRADLYALAATTYHFLTGVQLFPHSNPAVVISRHLSAVPPPLSDHRSDCAHLDGVLRAALAKNPNDRFTSCSAFAGALADERPERAAVSASDPTRVALRPNQLASARSAGGLRASSEKSAKLRPLIVVIAAVAALLLIGIGALAARALQPSDRATTEPATTTTNPPSDSLVALPSPAFSSNQNHGASAATTASMSPPSPKVAAEPSVNESPTNATVSGTPSNEQGFLAAANQLPMYVRANRYGGDAGLLEQGYRACAALDQYPNDSQSATRVIYPSGNTVNGSITMDGDMFMLYSANYLCPRHAHLYANY